MTRKLFGTDGIRGTANSEPMTPETALKVAMAVGECFQNGAHKHLVVIGKDTRLSGYMLEPALTAGFVTMGMDVVLVGPLPTPAIAMLTRSLRADLGVVLSASHNPYGDNGIKLFGRDGYKLSDEFEQKIETCLDKGPSRRAEPGGARTRQAARRCGRPLYRIRQAELSSRAAAGRAAHRRRLRARRRLQGRPDRLLGTRRRGLLARRLARRPQHKPRMRCIVARTDAARGSGAARRYRDCARRRCRSADHRRRARRHSRRRPADGADRDRAGAGRTAGGRRAGCDDHVQPRSRAVSRRPRVSGCTARRSATAMSSKRCARSAAISAASSPATSSCPIMRRPATA